MRTHLGCQKHLQLSRVLLKQAWLFADSRKERNLDQVSQRILWLFVHLGVRRQLSIISNAIYRQHDARFLLKAPYTSK